MTRRSAEIEAAIDELTKYGAVIKEVSTGGKHGRVVYVYKGSERFIVTCLSGSDWRGPMNARADVRHMLGIERGKKVGKRRQRKDSCRRDVAAPPDRITPGKDAFAALRMAAALKLPWQRAWELYFGTLLRDAGHTPINPRLRP